jgi:hypothetical protein
VIALCFDLPKPLKNSIKEAVMTKGMEIPLVDPFALHTVLVEEVVALFDHALWHWRDLVREIEKLRAYSRRLPISEGLRNRTANQPEPDYVTMHEIARHAIHSSETLEMAMETLSQMIQEHQAWFNDNPAENASKTVSLEPIRKPLQYQKTILKCLHGRAKAIEERLRNEINLVLSTYTSRVKESY